MSGLYSNYVGYYGQQAVPNPLVAPSGLHVFGSQPPFMPPKTVSNDQPYMSSSRSLQLGTLGASSTTAIPQTQVYLLLFFFTVIFSTRKFIKTSIIDNCRKL